MRHAHHSRPQLNRHVISVGYADIGARLNASGVRRGFVGWTAIRLMKKRDVIDSLGDLSWR